MPTVTTAVKTAGRATQPPAPALPGAGHTAAQRTAVANPTWARMALGAGAAQTGAAPIQRQCAACADDERLQRQAAAGPAHAPAALPGVVRSVLETPGRALDTAARAYFEPRFGADLGAVRLHTDGQAALAAQALRANAFSRGQHIYFGAGRFRPGEPAGDRLLAHELVHTRQAGRAPETHTRGWLSAPDDPAEREADALADRLVGHDTVRPLRPEAAAASAIHRDAVAPLALPSVDLSTRPDCVAARDDYRGVGPAGPTEALHDEVAALDAGTDAQTDLGRLLRVWSSYGPAGGQIFIFHLLEHLWIVGGRQRVDGFVEQVAGRVEQQAARQLPTDAPEVLRERQVAGALRLQQQRLHGISERFLGCYEALARETARGALDDSEQRVTGELVHYFGSSAAVQMFFGADDDPGQDTRSEDEDRASRHGLGLAAQGLGRRRRALINANAAYRRSVANTMLPWSERNPIEQEQLRAERDYAVFRQQVIPRFPILEEFSAPDIDAWEDRDIDADDEPGSRLDELARLADPAATDDGFGPIFHTVRDKLDNIAKVRKELKPDGDVDVWHVPKIVDATSALTGAVPGSLFGRLVEDKIHASPPRSLTSRLVDIVEIALYLLAPFTEGLTLVPAALITTGRTGDRVYQHWKAYQLGKAMQGTDFGAAALSADDPSLFWLGADIAVAFFEVGLSVVPAAKVFAELAPAARAARAALAGEEAVTALEAAAKALTVEELGAQKAGQFAARVAADARVAQAGGSAGMSAAEAQALEQTAAEASGAVLAEVRSSTGAALKITRGGRRLAVCSSPCQWLRERFGRQLALDEAFEQRLAALEVRAAEAAAQTDRATAERMAAELADELRPLHRDLAYAEYRQAGGTASRDLFVAGERAREIAESTAHLAATRIPAARVAEVSARLLARYPVLARLSPGALERVVRAAHALADGGGLRLALSWKGAARGQLLEEIVSLRVRGLLASQAGAESLGLWRAGEALVFIDGNRIRDAAGFMVTDGIVAIRRAEGLEIIGVIEAKAGSFAAGGLTESMASVRRSSASDIVQAVTEASGGRSGRVLMGKRAMVQRLSKLLTPEQYRLIFVETSGTNLAANARALAEVREPLLAAIEQLPARDRRAIREVLLHGEGQVSRDLERLMKEGSGAVELIVDGEAVTARIPSRPAFIGASPEGVPLTDIQSQLTGQGYAFRPLDMGGEGMTTAELDALAAALVDELGADLVKASKAAVP